MSRLIDADALIEQKFKNPISYNAFVNMIKRTPTVERKTGHWVVMETAYDDEAARCSECGFETLVNEPGNGLHMVSELCYCPNCGCRMMEVEHEAENT